MLILDTTLSKLFLLLVLLPFLTDRDRIPHTQDLSHFALFLLVHSM